MNDTMRFDPAEMKFKTGETVRFVVRNEGKIRHEMVIGTVDELQGARRDDAQNARHAARRSRT